MKNCLPDYLDGELDLDRRSLVDKHLEVCDACSQELSELRHAVFLLRRLPTPETPPMLVEKVVRQEPQLVEIFGADYEQYRAEVPLFIPWKLFLPAAKKSNLDS